MIAADRVAVVLLAAGRSSRFGRADKLAQPLNGTPLGLHAARMLASFPFAVRIVVIGEGGPDYTVHGFDPVNNPDPEAGQSGSIALGVARARLGAPDAILIALADMPLVTATHIEALLAASDERHPLVASTTGAAPGPPAIFGARLFDALETLSGDQGARHLLNVAALVAAPADILFDVDTPADLAVATIRSAYRTRPIAACRA